MGLLDIKKDFTDKSVKSGYKGNSTAQFSEQDKRL